MNARAYLPQPPAPELAVKPVAVEETIAQSVLLGIGTDVSVLHLAEPDQGVRPFIYAPFGTDTVGTRYSVVSCGGQDDNESTTGRDFEILFGSFQEFVRQPTQLTDSDLRGKTRRELRKIFDQEVLLKDETDVAGGRLAVVAVPSSTVASADLACNFGGVEAVFGPAVIELLSCKTAKPR